MRLHQLPPTLSREEKIAVRGREKGMKIAVQLLEEGAISGKEFRAMENALLVEGLGAAPMDEYIAARNSGLADYVLSRGEDREFQKETIRKVVKLALERAHEAGDATDEEFVAKMQAIGELPAEYTDPNGGLVPPAAEIGTDAWALRYAKANGGEEYKPGSFLGEQPDPETGKFRKSDNLHVDPDFAVAWKAAREPGDGLAGMANAIASDRRQYAEEAVAKAKAARSEAKDAADAVRSDAANINQTSSREGGS
jgi:hypothetical protein